MIIRLIYSQQEQNRCAGLQFAKIYLLNNGNFLIPQRFVKRWVFGWSNEHATCGVGLFASVFPSIVIYFVPFCIYEPINRLIEKCK